MDRYFGTTIIARAAQRPWTAFSEIMNRAQAAALAPGVCALSLRERKPPSVGIYIAFLDRNSAANEYNKRVWVTGAEFAVASLYSTSCVCGCVSVYTIADICVHTYTCIEFKGSERSHIRVKGAKGQSARVYVSVRYDERAFDRRRVEWCYKEVGIRGAIGGARLDARG